ncbi:MAG: hypothetical protein E7400_01770 [Ruminococcaceae bacterium]|nr:hypothetical protein [Oscillospiraceae bacterium]
MQEYLVKCRGKWWHFFMKPLYGLCYRRREGGRFLNFEVLLLDACEDFCATCMGDSIHIVCQDKNGSILYLNGAEGEWKRTVLLANKSSVPYPKHFSLVPVGNFLNLFYVIAYQEKQMLVHQILGVQDKPPTVVDRIAPGMPLFLAEPAVGTDIAVIYRNEAGNSGCRTFRWSKKEFGRFVPVNPSLGGQVCATLLENYGRTRYCALQKVESVRNLVYFEKTEDETFTSAVTVNLDCPKDSAPVFYREGEKLYLAWREAGNVMSSYSTDDGAKWSKPVKYMKGAQVVPVLYTLCEDGRSRRLYGFEKDREIVFYIGAGILDEQTEKKPKGFRPAGYEIEDFVKNAVAAEAEEKPAGDPAVEQLKKDFLHLKEQYFTLRRTLAEVTERIEELEHKTAGSAQ